MWISSDRPELRDAVQLYSLSLPIIALLGATVLTGDISAAILATLNISGRLQRGLLGAVYRGPGWGWCRNAPSRETPNASRGTYTLKLALFVAALVGTADSIAATDDEGPFLAENSSAMSKMMAAMDIKPAGDVDADFVAMMAPHHQGAIDMAKAELSYGRNEQLRRLAQEIIVTQQQEIQVMQLALSKPLPSAILPPDQLSHDRHQVERSMPHSSVHN